MRVRDLFQNIFVINLDKDTERWEYILSQFQKHNLKPPIRISAIDGNTLQIDKSIPLRKSQRACALSHLKAFQTAIDLGLEHFTVIEDDIEISDHVGAMMDRSLPEGWDCIFLGHCKWTKKGRNTYSIVPQPPYNEKIVNNFIKFTNDDDCPLCLYGTSYTRTFAEFIIKNYNKRYAIDLFLCSNEHFKLFNIYGLVPNVIIHPYKFGSLTSHKWELFRKDTRSKDLESLEVPMTFIQTFIYLSIILIIFKKFKIGIPLLISSLTIGLIIYTRALTKHKIYEHFRKNDIPIPGTFYYDHFNPFGNVWSENDRRLLRRWLKQNENKNYVLWNSTLLGYARTGDLIEWDDGFTILTDDDIEPISLGEFSPRIKIMKGKVPPRRQDIFLNVNIFVPENVHNILDTKYGKDWNTIAKSASYSHRLEQPIDPKYQAELPARDLYILT